MKISVSFTLFLVLLVVFFDWMGISLVYPMFSVMLFSPDSYLVSPDTSEAVRGWYLGLLLAAMSIAQFVSGPILGTLSDQKGRRRFFLYSIIVGIFGYCLCASAVWLGSFWFLLIGRVFVGISAGNGAVVSATIADLSTMKSKAKYFGLYSMACGVGFTTGSFLGGELSHFGFAVPFLFAAAVLVLSLFLMYFFFVETFVPSQSYRSVRFDVGLRNLKKAFALLELRILFLVTFLFCFGWSFFYEFIPVTWIFAYQCNAAQVGLFFAYGAAVYALSSGLLIQPIIKRFSQAQVLFYALLSLGITCLIILFSHLSVMWVWVYLPVVNFLMALLFPTSTAMVSNQVSKESQGEVLGVLQSVQAIAFAVSPLAAGTILGAYPRMPLFVGGLSMLIATLCLRVSGFYRRVQK